MTELAHRDRGYCCGNKCRHCPYEYKNVDKPEQIKKDAALARINKNKIIPDLF